MELWLDSLMLAPKSKAHIRGLLSVLWDYAQWRGDIPTQRNPMQLVTVRAQPRDDGNPVVSPWKSSTVFLNSFKSRSARWHCCACVSVCESANAWALEVVGRGLGSTASCELNAVSSVRTWTT